MGTCTYSLITICEQPNQANMMETSPRPSFHRHICSTPNQPDDAISEQQNTDTTNETNQTAHIGDDDVCDAVVDVTQSTAGRERHLSISCGTQAAPIFISVYETEFKFVRCLGRGAFGRVFEVENRFDGCRYAIKRIEIKEAGEDETRFLREVRVLASLDHPGIVRYHRAWSEHPPPGWQDACDRALMGSFGDNTGMDTGCSWDNDSVPQTNESRFCQTGSTSNKADGSSHFEPSVVDDFSRSSIRFSLNRRLDDSLIVFQRDAETDSRSCTRTDQSVARSTTSNISVDRRSPRSKRNRTTSTSEPSSTTSWYLYIQMQLCSQMSLRDWLISKNQAITRPSRTELYYMFWQIVDAVAYLHAHELMHRDLKPSNILFDSANRLKLADFGLVTSFADEDVNMDGDTDAKCGIRSSSGEVSEAHDSVACSSNSVSKQNTNSLGDSGHADSWSSGDTPNLSPGNVRQKYFGIRSARRQHTNDVGTDLYMSPEQERHEQYDRKVDIFSLGLIFLELLLPFETDMERICTLLKAKQQILPNHFTADYPLESAFIKRLLDPDPNERPSAADLIHDPLLSHAKPEQPHMSAMTSVAPRTVV
ncbi:hypothetical protein D915_008166 [Fasciola hepatica]|uniref:Protein kinase domain-containing protein n=1 Tax=Fasciola hepatica TaxID=6192 RepID=A0A4E0RXW2_FASHE|nr:hypothetical protein D915_008166 [Fasciola hepatica]